MIFFPNTTTVGADYLNRLGKVLHVSSTRRLILRAETKPSLGTQVYDSKLRPVGSVAEIFGPVKKPYISVKPIIDEPKRYVGRVLYMM